MRNTTLGQRQPKAAAVPGTGIVKAVDLGKRLGDVSLALTYGLDKKYAY